VTRPPAPGHRGPDHGSSGARSALGQSRLQSRRSFADCTCNSSCVSSRCRQISFCMPARTHGPSYGWTNQLSLGRGRAWRRSSWLSNRWSPRVRSACPVPVRSWQGARPLVDLGVQVLQKDGIVWNRRAMGAARLARLLTYRCHGEPLPSPISTCPKGPDSRDC